MKRLIFTLAFASVLSSSYGQKLYEKQVTFPENATTQQKLEMASRLVPTKQQLEWQKMELTCFLHFGVNTFTGREWGDGTEDPNVFNPSELDCDQWVRSLKDAGFKMAIITAKHHDGFCMWPTKTTDHSVASSSWKDGKGDVVAELRKACKKYGIKFGVYLSPWDRNAKCYGQGEEYNKYFIAQLTELLSNYGEVHEVWFDGANGEGPNGKKQVYDWTSILNTIHKLQPNAVTAIMGDDVRWVGNEGGLGRTTEWSATVLSPDSYEDKVQNSQLNINAMSKDLGGRSLVEKANKMYWYPSEVDVSIRPGWFYHAEEDNRVRSLANLANIYFQSVGYNSVLLLNIPPDRRGLLHENDVKAIKELGDYMKSTFADNKLVGGNKSWNAKAGQSKTFNVKPGVVNLFMIQEDISKGQRVEDFKVEILSNGAWHHVGEGTTIGYKRIIPFSDSSAKKVRVTINSSRGDANISNVGLYYASPLQDKGAKVKLSDVKRDAWKAVNADAAQAFDGKTETAWKANGLKPLTIDMGKIEEISGFTYAPVNGDDLSGTIYKYNFYVSGDGVDWTKCDATGEFSNIMHNPIPYFVRFGKKYGARYIKLEPLSEISGNKVTSVGEIGILK